MEKAIDPSAAAPVSTCSCPSRFAFSPFRVFAFSSLSALAFFCLAWQATVAYGSDSPAPPAEKIGEHRYRIGRVTVDTAARTVQVPCQVNMRRGPIEYLAVAAEGKRHESVLLVDAEPLHIHVALLLIGLEPGTRPRFQGDPEPARGPGIEAQVTWREEERTRSARLEELAWNIPAKRPMEPVSWLFTGAAPPGPGPRTAEEHSVVATYRDPFAVLNNPLPTGADDTVYKVNERLVPAVGTAMTLVLRPAGKSHHGDTETRREAGNARVTE